jgi:hypothetical protein
MYLIRLYSHHGFVRDAPCPRADSDMNLKLDRILDGQRQLTRHNMLLTKVVIAHSMPTPSSSKSQREYHQRETKSQMRVYYRCVDENNPHVTKCLVLNTFFPTETVTYAHIVGVTEKQHLTFLGMDFTDLWSPKNGLLIHQDIERQFTENNVVSIFLVIYNLS